MKKTFLPLLILTIFVMSGCASSNELSDIQLTQTVVALQLTQIAIAQVSSSPSSDENIVTSTNTPTSTPQPPTITFTPTNTPIPPTSTILPTPSPCIGVGCAAPNFTLPLFGGGEMSLSELRGKSILLNFWASWCGPCRAETPDLQRAYEQYGDQNFVVIGISTDETDTVDNVSDFISEFGITYPVLLDTDLTVGTEYESTFYTGGVPNSFFIDPQGIIRNIGSGYMEANEIDTKVIDLIDISTSEPIASGTDYAFFDDFSDPTSGWDQDRENSAIRRHYLDGEYHVFVKEEFVYNGTTLPSLRFSNFVLEVDVRQVPGTEGFYGLIFSDDPLEDSHYELQFASTASNASARLYQNGEDGVGAVTNWIRVDNANTSGGTNHLKVILQGNFVEAYINDQLVVSLTLENLPSAGYVGMYACTCDGTRQADVYFDNFGVIVIP